MKDWKDGFLHTAALFMSSVIIAGSGAFAVPSLEAEAAVMQNQDGVYLNEALSRAGGGSFIESREQWAMTLDKYSITDYYLGTPFSDWAYAASPYGDKWQFDEGYGWIMDQYGGDETNGSMNCTGFLWHILSKSISENSGVSMEEAAKGVPILNHFNEQGFSYSSWTGGGNRWFDFINENNVHYYEFNTKAEMLRSGVLQKGDIIWCVDRDCGTLMNGLKTPSDDHHVGIYMGDGDEDLWWQSGPIYGNGDKREQQNSINPVYGCAVSNTYIVLPWSGSGETPVNPRIQPYMYNSDGWYMGEAINMASLNTCSGDLAKWQSFIDEYTTNDYYKGTPYIDWVYASSPRGDKWQMNEWSVSEMLKVGGTYEDGGLNCMGFVWHAIAKGLSVESGLDISVTGQYVPFSSYFNGLGLSRKCWSTASGNGGWTVFVDYYNLHYYEFPTKQEMLSSGVLQKGDIIWCVDGSVGLGMAGLRTIADNHHIGIYTGDGTSDSWWQSGPVKADGDLVNVGTDVCPIYGAASKNTYVVIPWAKKAENVTTTTTTTTSTTTTTTTTTTTATTTTSSVTTTSATAATSSTAETTSVSSTAESTAASETATTSVTTVSETTTAQPAETTTAATTSEVPVQTDPNVVLKSDAGEKIFISGVKAEELVESAKLVDDNGFVSEFTPEELSFGRDKTTPDIHFEKDGEVFKCLIDIYYGDILLGSPEIARVLKGDVNMDGIINAIDASAALTYYAKISADQIYYLSTGDDKLISEIKERIAFLAADIDTESVCCGVDGSGNISAKDASAILTYYAKNSAGQSCTWDEMFG